MRVVNPGQWCCSRHAPHLTLLPNPDPTPQRGIVFLSFFLASGQAGSGLVEGQALLIAGQNGRVPAQEQ